MKMRLLPVLTAVLATSFAAAQNNSPVSVLPAGLKLNISKQPPAKVAGAHVFRLRFEEKPQIYGEYFDVSTHVLQGGKRGSEPSKYRYEGEIALEKSEDGG